MPASARPSEASLALELGADAVLVNTAIAKAKDPAGMAEGFRLGVEAGRMAYLAGRIEKKAYASASSPARGRGQRKRPLATGAERLRQAGAIIESGGEPHATANSHRPPKAARTLFRR